MAPKIAVHRICFKNLNVYGESRVCHEQMRRSWVRVDSGNNQQKEKCAQMLAITRYDWHTRVARFVEREKQVGYFCP